MFILITSIILYLFLLSKEVIELPQFGSIYMNLRTEIHYFLDTSIYKSGDTIKISIEFSSKSYSVAFLIYHNFSNTLDFGRRFEGYQISQSQKTNYNNHYNYLYEHKLKMVNNSEYLLLIIPQTNYLSSGTLTHSNKPISSSIQLIGYSSLLVNGSTFIYLNNSYQNVNYNYFSFSFDNIDNFNSTEYNIYYTLEDIKDDRAYRKMNNSLLTNPKKRIINILFILDYIYIIKLNNIFV